MKTPAYRILVCNSFLFSGEPQGVSDEQGSPEFLPLLEEDIIDGGLDALVNTTGCFKACELGPVLVDYPNNWWYGEITEDKIQEIFDVLEDGKVVGDYLIACNWL